GDSLRMVDPTGVARRDVPGYNADMPLLDHFRPPMEVLRHWSGFHSGWSSSLAAGLNELLGKEFFAQPNVHYSIEIDVATWKVQPFPADGPESAWLPPAPTATLPLPLLADLVEVQVYRHF